MRPDQGDLTQNRAGDHLLCGMTPNQLSYTSQTHDIHFSISPQFPVRGGPATLEGTHEIGFGLPLHSGRRGDLHFVGLSHSHLGFVAEALQHVLCKSRK